MRSLSLRKNPLRESGSIHQPRSKIRDVGGREGARTVTKSIVLFRASLWLPVLVSAAVFCIFCARPAALEWIVVVIAVTKLKSVEEKKFLWSGYGFDLIRGPSENDSNEPEAKILHPSGRPVPEAGVNQTPTRAGEDSGTINVSTAS